MKYIGIMILLISMSFPFCSVAESDYVGYGAEGFGKVTRYDSVRHILVVDGERYYLQGQTKALVRAIWQDNPTRLLPGKTVMYTPTVKKGKAVFSALKFPFAKGQTESVMGRQ